MVMEVGWEKNGRGLEGKSEVVAYRINPFPLTCIWRFWGFLGGFYSCPLKHQTFIIVLVRNMIKVMARIRDC